MAFPTIQTTATTNGTTATAAPVVNLPATIQNKDLLVVLIRVAVAGAIGWPTGWTELFDVSDDAADDQIALAWRRADGTEGSTITLSSGNGKFAALAYRIRDADDPQVSTRVTGASTTPDPPSFSPSGGSNNYLWLWLGGWEGEQTSPPASTPTNYTNALGASSGTAGVIATNCRVASARRENAVATENPPSWTVSASDDWTACVIAIPPKHWSLPSVGSLAASGVAGLMGLALNTVAGAVVAVGLVAAVIPGNVTLLTPSAGEIFLGLDEGASASRTPLVGTLSLAADAPTLRQDVRVTPNVGTLALISDAPSIVQATGSTPLVGTATFTFVAPSLLVDNIRGPPVGSLTLTGFAPTLQASGDTAITPAVGALALTGIESSSVRGTPLTPSVGNLFFGLEFRPFSGTLALASTAPRLDLQIAPPAGTLTTSGAAFSLDLGVPTPVATHSFTGFSPTIETGTAGTITPSVGSLSATGAVTTIHEGRLSEPLAGASSLSGIAPTVTLPTVVLRTPDAGALVITGAVPALSIGTVIGPNTDIQAQTGELFFGLGDITKTPTAGSLALTGVAGVADRIGSPSITPPVVALMATGQAASLTDILNTSIVPNSGQLKLDRNPTPGNGILILQGFAPTLAHGIAPVAGSLSLAGNAGRNDRGIVPSIGSLTLTGVAPTITLIGGLEVTPSAGNLVLTGERGPEDKRIQPAGVGLSLIGAAPDRDQILVTQAGALDFIGVQAQITGVISLAPRTGLVTTIGNASQVTAITSTLRTTITGSLDILGARPNSAKTITPETGRLGDILSGIIIND